MNWPVVLGISASIGVPLASLGYSILRDKRKDRTKVRRTISTDDANLRDDQREYIRVLSGENRELRERMDAVEKARDEDRKRIDCLERGRAEDHRTIDLLRDYLRRVLRAIPDDVTVPPPPAELQLHD